MGTYPTLRETVSKHAHDIRFLAQTTADIIRKYQKLEMRLSTPIADALKAVSTVYFNRDQEEEG